MAGQQTLILRLRLATEMETVKSQRGAKSGAQYGMAHQNALQVMKMLVINAIAAQKCKDLNLECKVCMEQKKKINIWVVRHSSVPAVEWRGASSENTLTKQQQRVNICPHEQLKTQSPKRCH